MSYDDDKGDQAIRYKAAFSERLKRKCSGAAVLFYCTRALVTLSLGYIYFQLHAAGTTKGFYAPEKFLPVYILCMCVYIRMSFIESSHLMLFVLRNSTGR